jgi:hypothetical protein
MQASTVNRSRYQPFIVAVLAFIPVLACIVLPAIGIGAFQQFFQLNRLLLLFGGLIGSAFYIHYFRFVQSRPQLLVAFIVLAWPVVAYISGQLLRSGINLHLRPLLLIGIAAPCIWLSIRHWELLRQNAPWMKYYLFFLCWMFLYSIFFNVKTVDSSLSGDEAGEGSVSLVQMISYLYCLLAMNVGTIATLKTRQPHRLFDVFNRALILISSLEALITVLGFPFGLFSMPIDGFMRASGIFSHPNTYAHHMGILMVYLLGLFCYYQGEREKRMPGWLLFGGIGVNGVAFLLGLSKTALGVYSLCALLLLLLNLGIPAVRRGFVKIAIAGTVLVPLGLLGFQVLTGESFFAILESRLEQTQSMSWRNAIWQELLAHVNLQTIWFGHGLSAANDLVYRISYNDATNAHPLIMIHNAYIALIYDLGILGYAMFACTFSYCWNSLKRGWLSLKTEHTIILALSLYFLFVCGFDEMSYMFDAPMLYWTLCSILFCMSLREQPMKPKTAGKVA